MKKGDSLQVSVEGIPVGKAVVEYVGEGKVTILIPAMRTVMGLKTQLDPETKQEPEKEVIVEVERAPGDGDLSGEVVSNEGAPEAAESPVTEANNSEGETLSEPVEGAQNQNDAE